MEAPSLTYVLIGLAIFIGCVFLIYNPGNPTAGIYSGIILANNGILDSDFITTYQNMSTNKGGITALGSEFSNPTNLLNWDTLINIGASIVNTLVLGINAIYKLIQIPTYLQNINAALKAITPLPLIFWWIIETIITVYCAAMLIKALRGTNQES